MKKVTCILLTLFMFIGLFSGLPMKVYGEAPLNLKEEISTTVAPAGYNRAIAAANYQGEMNVEFDGAPDFKVLVIQDTLPWNSNANAVVLNKLKVNYRITTTAEADTLNLSDYATIIVANDQTTAFYERYSFIKAKLEGFVRDGGSLIFGACDGGWGGNGTLEDTLPGGVEKVMDYSYYNYIDDAEHPIVTGVLTDGISLTDSLLYHNYCSHDYFVESTLPPNANVILRSENNGQPTLVEYSLGKGRVIASGLTWEHSYDYRWNGYAQIAMDDYFRYGFPVFDMGFNVSSTVLNMVKGSEEVITVTPKAGFEFINDPTVTIDNQANVSIIHYKDSGVDKYQVKSLSAGEAKISVQATYRPKGAQNANNISSSREVIVKIKEVNTITVKGQFSYVDKNNNNVNNPVKNNPVIVYNSSGPNNSILGRTITDNQGKFTIEVPKVDKIKVSAPARYNRDEVYSDLGRIDDASVWLKVNVDSPKDDDYYLSSMDFTTDVTSDEIKFTFVAGSQGSNCNPEPFFMLETIKKGFDYWVNNTGLPIKPVKAYYNTKGYIKEYPTQVQDWSWSWRLPNFPGTIIHMKDEHAWQDTTMLHELGHSIMANYSRQGEGGPHYGNEHYSNALAYSEGWAHFFAHACLNNETFNNVGATYNIAEPYVDYGLFSRYGFKQLKPQFDLNPNSKSTDKTTVYNEYASAAILWDVFQYYNRNFNAVAQLMIEPEDKRNEQTNPDIFDFFNRANQSVPDIWNVFYTNAEGFVDLRIPTNVQISPVTAEISQDTIFTVTAEDEVGIGRVDFFIRDGKSLKYVHSDNSAPFTYNMKINDILGLDIPIFGVDSKDVSLVIRVSDKAGNEYTKISWGDTKFVSDVAKYGFMGKNSGYTPYAEKETSLRVTRSKAMNVAGGSNVNSYISQFAAEDNSASLEITKPQDIPESLVSYATITLSGDLSGATIEQKDRLRKYIEGGGTLLVTPEGYGYITASYGDIFKVKGKAAGGAITYEESSLKEFAGAASENLTISRAASTLEPSRKLTVLASQGDSIICAAAGIEMGRIFWLPFDSTSDQNKLLNYVLTAALSNNLRSRVIGALGQYRNILDNEHYYYLQPGESATLKVNKLSSDCLIGLENSGGNIKISVQEPDGSVYSPNVNKLYPYLLNLEGEYFGLWTVKVQNIGNTAAWIPVFTSKPQYVIAFDGIFGQADSEYHTNKRSLELMGAANGYSYINFALTNDEYPQGRTFDVDVTEDGNFAKEFNLALGFNTLSVYGKDDKGNSYEKQYLINYHTDSPVIRNTGDFSKEVYTDEITLIFSTDRECQLTINGEQAEMRNDSMGNILFSKTVTLQVGDNVFAIEAIDKAGNKTEKQITIVRAPITTEGINPVITGLSVKENDVINKSRDIQAYIEEDSEYIMRAWLGQKELIANGDNIQVNIDNIPNGIHSLVVKVVDKWGNEAQTAITLNVDTSRLDVLRLGICDQQKNELLFLEKQNTAYGYAKIDFAADNEKTVYMLTSVFNAYNELINDIKTEYVLKNGNNVIVSTPISLPEDIADYRVKVTVYDDADITHSIAPTETITEEPVIKLIDYRFKNQDDNIVSRLTGNERIGTEVVLSNPGSYEKDVFVELVYVRNNAITQSEKKIVTLSQGDNLIATALLDTREALDGDVIYCSIWSSANKKQQIFDVMPLPSYGVIKTQVATPYSNLTSGIYSLPQTVVLTTTTEGAEIYYSTDESTPNKNSKKYTEPIKIDNSMKIKAIALKEGMLDSDVSEFSYTKSIQVTKIALKKKTIKLGANNPFKLEYTITPSNATAEKPIWSSSNDKVAIVDEDGNVTGVGKGTSVITASAADGSNKTATCKVTISPVESIKMSKTTLSIKEGAKASLKATISPSSAVNKNVLWKSSDEEIVKIDEKGSILAVKNGAATVMAQSEENSELIAECRVVVETPVTSIKLNASKAALSTSESYNQLQLVASVLPEQASNKEVLWKSSNESVATVTEDGLVTAVSQGTASITATTVSGNKVGKCTVTVAPVKGMNLSKGTVDLKVGKSMVLKVTVSPTSAPVKDMLWQSSDESKVIVTKYGKLIAVAPTMDGESVIIRATSLDNPGVHAECRVTVGDVSTVVNVSEIHLTNVKGGKILVGKTGSIRAKVIGEGKKTPTNSNILWQSSDENIAVVDDSGKVTAKSSGSVTITAAAADGSGASSEIEVKVAEP